MYPDFVELEVRVRASPRRPSEIQTPLLLAPGVQACLRATDEIRHRQFQVPISGLLEYTGAVRNLNVGSLNAMLKNCLEREIGALSFGRGRSGPFKVVIGHPNGESLGAKPLLLDLSTGKKWE